MGKIKTSPPSQLTPPDYEVSQLVTLFNTGHNVELENRVRPLLEQYPDSGIIWKLLGLSLQMQGREALPAFQKAVALLPDDAEAHNNLGTALDDLERFDEAMASYRQALKLKPGYAEAHSNLGNTLKDLGQFDEAIACYRRALEIKPDSPAAHYGLGNAFKDAMLLNDAIASYRHAIMLQPDFAEVYSNLGNALHDLRQFDEAMINYRRALELNPNLVDTYSNLLFALSYNPDLTPAAYLAEARLYGQMMSDKVTSRFTAWQCDAEPNGHGDRANPNDESRGRRVRSLSPTSDGTTSHPTKQPKDGCQVGGYPPEGESDEVSLRDVHVKRLRVGMVSGDLRGHSVGHFLESLLGHIDPGQIELYAYPTQPEEDALTARIKPYFAAWKPLTGLNDPAAAQLIHADGVHILIDLSGHTAHNRLPLFAWKPAPVQFTWIGFPATTGLAEMDYVLGDPIATPVADEGHFSEQVWRLPESYLCLTPPDVALEVSPLPALASGFVTFASFNNLTKMSDATVSVWARVLQAVPGSRLLLKSKQLQDASVLAATVQRFAAHGITKDRLLLEGWAPQRIDHLSAYQRADIALDTFPYRGVTTSGEALWMGVPVVTLKGDRFLSRTAESIAHNAGLADWIAADEDDYVAKAVAHSADLERLATLRSNLRQQVLASPLFDAPRFARSFEEALWGMWREHQDNNQWQT